MYNPTLEPPVIEGEFPTGPELMLWRPGLDHTRLRRHAVRASMIASPMTYAVIGVALVALGATPIQVGWPVLVAAILILGGYVLVVWVNYQCADYDHQHKRCLLDKNRGEYFYRPSDFRDLSPSIVYSVDCVISTVRDVHNSPASAWLDPHHLRELHQVAWHTLRTLDRTWELRRLAEDPRCQAVPDDLHRTQTHLTALDDSLEDVVNYLRQAAFLVQAWEQKLTETELRSQLRTELANASDDTITPSRAELLVENVFAYITAARDITHAGAFVWERARP